jgi:hypothetical protein
MADESLKRWIVGAQEGVGLLLLADRGRHSEVPRTLFTGNWSF